MVAFLLLAVIVIGIWFFVLKRESRDKLRVLWDMAARVVRKEMEERKK